MEAFGRYWLHETIGTGGMADIYRATMGVDPSDAAFHVAVKILRPKLAKNPQQVAAFFTEAAVVRFLRHPNIVRVYEAGTQGGRPYIAMEFVDGHDLATFAHKLKRRKVRLPALQAVYIVMQVLRALDYVHQAKDVTGCPMGIVHRDVTPSNIHVSRHGEVKLGDFGIALIRSQHSPEEGVARGKAAYMPPEVWAGKPVDKHTDLWSIAVVLYELLTARRLFEDVDDSKLRSGVRQKKIVPVHKVVGDIDKRLGKILVRALDKHPGRRLSSAAMLYKELKFYLLSTGMQTDAATLGQLVASVIERDPRREDIAGGSVPGGRVPGFVDADYHAPIELSPTQRYELVRKRRLQQMPLWTLAGAVLVGAGAALVWPPGQENPVLDAEGGQPTASVEASEEGAVPTSTAENAALKAEEAKTAEEIEEAEETSDGSQFQVLMRRARARTKRGRFADAVEVYEKAAALQPGDAQAHLGWARALHELGREDEAQELVEGVLQREPDNARAYLLLGHVLRARGDLVGARQAYGRCAALDRGRVGKIARDILMAP